MWSDLFTKQKTAREFWEQALGIACEMTGAATAFLYIRDSSVEAPQWKVVSVVPTGNKPVLNPNKAKSVFESLVENPDGEPFVQSPGEVILAERHFLGAVCLKTPPKEPDCVLLITAPADTERLLTMRNAAQRSWWRGHASCDRGVA